MTNVDLIKLSTRIFIIRPMRTFLTVVGVSVGIGAILFLVSMGYGLQNLLLEKITTSDALLSLDVHSTMSEIIILDDKTIESFKNIDGVVEVSPMASIPSQVSFNNISSDLVANFIDTAYFRLGGIETIMGDIFEENTSDEIVISSAVASLFEVSLENILNEKMFFTFYLTIYNEEGVEEVKVVQPEKPFIVKGILDDKSTPFVFLPHSAINELNGQEYSQVKVKVKNNETLEPVREEIISRGFLVSALSDMIDQANKIFKIIQIVLGIFGLVALVVSAIGMFNTMTIALLERTNEIGIMKAIGASNQDVAKLFLTESMIMGFLGGLGGIIVGFVSGYLFNSIVNILAKTLGGQTLDLFHTPIWFMIFIIVFSTITGFMTGIFPARRASGLDSLQALRYK